MHIEEIGRCIPKPLAPRPLTDGVVSRGKPRAIARISPAAMTAPIICAMTYMTESFNADFSGQQDTKRDGWVDVAA